MKYLDLFRDYSKVSYKVYFNRSRPDRTLPSLVFASPASSDVVGNCNLSHISVNDTLFGRLIDSDRFEIEWRSTGDGIGIGTQRQLTRLLSSWRKAFESLRNDFLAEMKPVAVGLPLANRRHGQDFEDF